MHRLENAYRLWGTEYAWPLIAEYQAREHREQLVPDSKRAHDL